MKAGGADKSSLAPVIAELVALKADFEGATGTPFDPPKKEKAKKKATQDVGKQGGKEVRAQVGLAWNGTYVCLQGHLPCMRLSPTD